MTTENISKVRFDPQGEWITSGTYTYAIDDIVTYRNSTYICKVPNANIAPPDINTVEWTKLGGIVYHAGEWSNNTTYRVGDIINHKDYYGLPTSASYGLSYTDVSPSFLDYALEENYTFICTQEHTNKNPLQRLTGNNYSSLANTNYWNVVSKGNGDPKMLFLGAVNEGYVTPLKKLWDGLSGSYSGALHTIRVINTGSGYTSTPTINISGGGGANAAAFPVINSSGHLVDVIITSCGGGYTSTPTITVTGGGGSGANLLCNISLSSSNTHCGLGDGSGAIDVPGSVQGYNQVTFINKRYGLTFMGYNDSNWPSGINAAATTEIMAANEIPYTNLDYYEGILPTPDGEPPKIIQAEVSGLGNLVLFNNGEVHYNGYNGHGQAGSNMTTQTGYSNRCGYWNQGLATATSVLRGKRAIRIAMSKTTGSTQSCYALVQNPDGTRTIYSWGYNGYGQLGLGDTTQRLVPTAVNFSETLHGQISNIWATGGGYGNLWVLTMTGKLFSCGYNGYGQLGVNDAVSKTSLTQVSPGGSGNAWDGNNKIKKFSSGYAQSVASYAILTNGEIWSWGYNAAGTGYLGHGFARNIYIPIQTYTLGYTDPGAVVTTANYSSLAPASGSTLITGAGDVWRCSGEGTYDFIVYADLSSSLYASGYNGYYNLGDGTATNRATFVPMTGPKTGGTNAQLDGGLQVTDLTAGYNNNYVTMAVRTSIDGGNWNNEWFFSPYSNGSQPIGHTDTYNIQQFQDSAGLATNYRYKNNGMWPSGTIKKSLIRYFGSSTSKGIMMVDLRSGQVYISGPGAGAVSLFLQGSNRYNPGLPQFHPLPHSGM